MITDKTKYLNATDFELSKIYQNENTSLNTEKLYESELHRIEKSLSLMSSKLLNSSIKMPRLKSKYIEEKVELENLKLDIARIIKLIQNND